MKALEVMFVIPSVSIDFIDVTLVSDDTYGDDEDEEHFLSYIEKSCSCILHFVYLSIL